MAVTRITCPKCKSSFTLKAPNLEQMANKPFRCPKCGFSAPFGQLLGPDARKTVPLHTNIGQSGPVVPGGKTMVAAPQSTPGIAGATVTLLAESVGRSFKLAHGVYTLGRDSSDGQATIRIAPDPYMSRMQAKLEVIPTAGGPVCRITGVSNTNPIFINDRQLYYGTTGMLKNGDVILLGMTKVKITM